VTFRPTAAVVDLEAIAANVRRLRPRGTELMAVVKADGYGHGAVPVARTALRAGATWLGVALVEEGIALREAGLDAPVLLLSEVPRGAEKEALEHGLTPTIYTREGLAAIAEASASIGGPARCHVKVDTGMHRVGAALADAPGLCSDAVRRGIEVEGLWTHLAVADEPRHSFTTVQLERFRAALAEVEAVGVRPRYRHAANSAATMTLPEAHFDMVRVGIAMYGLAPSPALASEDLRPAMSLRSRVSMVKRLAAGEEVSYGLRYRLERPSVLATVPLGYADGYARLLSGRGLALIGGRRHPIAGTVTMDQILVDCGDAAVSPGDEVVLFGYQGEEEISAEEIASWYGTIGYEVVCGVSARVPREYRGGP